MSSTPTTIAQDDVEAMRDLAQRAGEALRAGQLVIFPTETVYGVAASALSEQGLSRLRRLKQRPAGQPFTVHLPDPGSAGRYVDMAQPQMRRLVGKTLPGPVTLVVDVSQQVIEQRLSAMGLGLDDADRIYHGQTVGLRCPDHSLAQMILGAVDAPIVASSANIAGEAAPLDVEAAAKAANDDVALIVDGGHCRYAKPSTIIRVTGEGAGQHFEVQREGVYDERFVRKLLRWTAVFVCSGNTCRSPRAEAIAKDILAKERGIGFDDLEAAGIEVKSAGAFAAAGMAAADEAVDAMQRQGIDLSAHRSSMLTREMIDEADVIYCMTGSHLQAVLDLAPDASDKALLLDPNRDVDDPIGAGPTAYQRCAEILRRRLVQRLKEQQL